VTDKDTEKAEAMTAEQWMLEAADEITANAERVPSIAKIIAKYYHQHAVSHVAPQNASAIKEVMEQHETNYVQRPDGRWDWSCVCGAKQWFHDRAFADDMTRSHWADEIFRVWAAISAASHAASQLGTCAQDVAGADRPHSYDVCSDKETWKPAAASGGSTPPRQHQVNPATDRCTMCGRNRWQRDKFGDIFPYQPTEATSPDSTGPQENKKE
jgi:hypothetical protein